MLISFRKSFSKRTKKKENKKMMELTINGQVYHFNFGMGFLREMNKKLAIPEEGIKGKNKEVGLRYAVAGIMDGDLEQLEEVLDTANKGQDPRVTKKLLDDYIEDENTDIDRLFDEVLDFLEKTNATKNTVKNIRRDIARAEQMETAKNAEK